MALLMQKQRSRAVAALLTSIAVVAAVVCVLSASDNEAALQEVELPAKAAAVQGRMQRPMDSTVVEHATSAALMHDIGAFLMSRSRRAANVAANVMHKRMARANTQHQLAPTQQFYEELRDPAFPQGTTDPDFKDGKDPAFAGWIPHDVSETAFNRAVEEGNHLEWISSHMKQAEEEEMGVETPDEDHEDDGIDMNDTTGHHSSLSWDFVLGKIQKSWNQEKKGSVQHGTFKGYNVPAQTEVTNTHLHRLNDDGRDMTNTEASFPKAQGTKVSTPVDQTPDQPETETSYGPVSSPERTVVPPTPIPPVQSGLTDLKDPAFSPPNMPKTVPDTIFGKNPDPAFVKGELVATKTAVQLAKKAMAEHAKKTKKAPEQHSAMAGFDLSKQAAENINQAKIKQLREATARKERKYKKAMAMVESTNNHIKKPTPPQKMATIKFIKN